MSPELAAKIAASTELIRVDLDADIKAYDGNPFNGETVGEALGNLSAAVYALAGMLQQLAKESQS